MGWPTIPNAPTARRRRSTQCSTTTTARAIRYNDGSGVIDERAAADQAGDSDARPQGRRRRQRRCRREVALCRVPLGHLHGMESDHERARSKDASVRSPADTSRLRRPGPNVSRAAIRGCRSRNATEPVVVLLGGRRSRRRPGEAAPAAPRRRHQAVEATARRHGEQQAACEPDVGRTFRSAVTRSNPCRNRRRPVSARG